MICDSAQGRENSYGRRKRDVDESQTEESLREGRADDDPADNINIREMFRVKLSIYSLNTFELFSNSK